MTDNLDFESVEHARNKVYDTSQGNPKMIVELCHRLSKEDVLVPETVNEICDNYIGRQVKEIDMSFILLFVMGGVMLMRYIGRENHDPDLRMVGGLMMIVMLLQTFWSLMMKPHLIYISMVLKNRHSVQVDLGVL